MKTRPTITFPTILQRAEMLLKMQKELHRMIRVWDAAIGNMARAVLASGVLVMIGACSSAPVDATSASRTPLASAQNAGSHPPADFSGVWVTIDLDHVKWPNEDTSNYTDLILKRVEDYKKMFRMTADESGKLCYYRGMPWVMLNKARDFPTEIYQTPDRVILSVELFDTHRNIRLDRTDFPENFPPSGNGFSIAHWEGSTLVVETRGFTPTYSISATHRSAEAYMVERWNLRQDPTYGEVLDVDFTIHDPIVYKEPAKARNIMKRAPAGTEIGGYNCADALWETFINNADALWKIFIDKN